VTIGWIAATGGLGHRDLSTIGDEVVLLFGSLLSAACLYCIVALGIRTMSGGRHKSPERKRDKRAKRLAPFR